MAEHSGLRLQAEIVLLLASAEISILSGRWNGKQSIPICGNGQQGLPENPGAMYLNFYDFNSGYCNLWLPDLEFYL
jgi:hypothetical protein